MYKILVADDERWIRKGIIKMIDLESLHISEVYEADSVRKAIEVYDEYKPDIVISDVRFPVEDGCTLCENIYMKSQCTQIIMISGYSEFEYVKRALSYKAIDYLLKPVDKLVLNNTISRGIEELLKLNKVKNNDTNNIETKNTDFIDEYSQEGIQKIIKDAMEHIQIEYRNKITLTDLSNKYHLSEAYFSYAFKKISGISLMNYIMEVRIEKAKELMVSSNYKLKDIANYIGYTDQHYFTKVFKKVTGLSPKEYKLNVVKDIFEDE